MQGTVMMSNHEDEDGIHYDEATGFDLRHSIWKESLGYILHPKIPQEGKLQILDVHTFTGIWAMDVAKALPASTVVGYDVMSRFIPATERLSKQVVWLHKNPWHMFEHYDIVHVREFPVVYNEENMSNMLDKCFKILKPGGYLQWEEHDFDSIQLKCLDSQGTPKPLADSVSKMVREMKKERTPDNWANKLLGAVLYHGFHVYEMDKIEPELRYAQMLTNMDCRSWEKLDPLAIGGGTGKEPDSLGIGKGTDMRSYVQQLYRQMLETKTYIDHKFRVIVAKKPEEGEDTDITMKGHERRHREES